MKNKFAALALGWLVPGAGHLYAGKKLKAFIFFFAIVPSAAIGLVMGSYRNIYFRLDHYQFYAEIGNGLFTAAASLYMWLFRVAPIEAVANAGAQASILPVADLYCMIAGLLNLVVAASAFDTVAAQARRQQ